MSRIDVTCHFLVPKHSLLTENEVQEILARLNITKNQLPKIHRKDPVVSALDAQEGDVLKIERESDTAGYAIAYRLVVDKETLI